MRKNDRRRTPEPDVAPPSMRALNEGSEPRGWSAFRAILKLCGAACALALGGCATLLPQTAALHAHPPTGIPSHVELSQVPFFPQEGDQCGPTALSETLDAAGARATPETLRPEVYLPERHGSLQVEMLAAARQSGMIAYRLAPKLVDVLTEVAAGTPVIVLQDYGFNGHYFLLPNWFHVWHYAVVVGYDLPKSLIVLRSGQKRRLVMPFGVFEYLWRDSGEWAMIATSPERMPVTAGQGRYTRAAVALEEVGELKAARAAYGTLLRRWPGSLTGLMGEGNTAYALGDKAAAAAAFRRAARLHPDATAAFNNLAQTLADEGHRARALVAARRAVHLGGPLRATAEATLKSILAQRPGSASE